MQRTINCYLSNLIKCAYPPHMWHVHYRTELDPNAVSQLASRHRFPQRLIQAMTQDSSNAFLIMRSDEISIADKLIALSVYKTAPSKSHMQKAITQTIMEIGDRTGECLVESGLNMPEVLTVLNIAIKYLYSIKSQCDIKAYWMTLDQHIPWQSFTNPLKRFPTAQRKAMGRKLGRILCSYTTAGIHESEKPVISIF